jgi:hypothetical protein
MQHAACQGHVAMVVGCPLQGRRWPDVEKRFADMWGMALRALDDVKESVGYVSWVSSMIKRSNSLPII